MRQWFPAVGRVKWQGRLSSERRQVFTGYPAAGHTETSDHLYILLIIQSFSSTSCSLNPPSSLPQFILHFFLYPVTSLALHLVPLLIHLFFLVTYLLILFLSFHVSLLFVITISCAVSSTSEQHQFVHTKMCAVYTCFLLAYCCNPEYRHTFPAKYASPSKWQTHYHSKGGKNKVAKKITPNDKTWKLHSKNYYRTWH
jgi:hypothetical protein